MIVDGITVDKTLFSNIIVFLSWSLLVAVDFVDLMFVNLCRGFNVAL